MSVELVIDARKRDIGGSKVWRTLPYARRRRIGPFTFFDHFGPDDLQPGQEMAVRPHPHIGIATVTYLFDGEVVHRDSLGSHQPIRPGAINWMHAGRGIVHSERSEPLTAPRRMHGLQLWVALPRAAEESDPAFRHYPAATLPEVVRDDVPMRVLAGRAFGVTSPVETASPLFYAEARVPAGRAVTLPPEYTERAAYVVDGSIDVGSQRASRGRMLVFETGSEPVLRATTDCHLVFVGGEPLDGPRHMYWNFVSSDPARLEQAKADWREGRFPEVPGDDGPLIPLPE